MGVVVGFEGNLMLPLTVGDLGADLELMRFPLVKGDSIRDYTVKAQVSGGTRRDVNRNFRSKPGNDFDHNLLNQTMVFWWNPPENHGQVGSILDQFPSNSQHTV